MKPLFFIALVLISGACSSEDSDDKARACELASAQYVAAEAVVDNYGRQLVYYSAQGMTSAYLDTQARLLKATATLAEKGKAKEKSCN